jgi:hypothetical protein
MVMPHARLKSKSSRVMPRSARRAPDYDVEEALWAAYRRYDKTAVTEKLLRRYWMRMAHVPRGTRKNYKRPQTTGMQPEHRRTALLKSRPEGGAGSRPFLDKQEPDAARLTNHTQPNNDNHDYNEHR